MKFLVIGLGSMGKRRIRNLISLGYHEILGYDIKKDRMIAAKKEYGIQVFNSLKSSLSQNPNLAIISTWPNTHLKYVKLVTKNKIPFFTEVNTEPDHIKKIIDQIKKHRTIGISSMTMKFHPAVQTIKKFIDKNKLGKIYLCNYHSGENLEDWHPWENIQDYYVRNISMGGGRDQAVFEVEWIFWLFGKPKDVMAKTTKLSKMPARIFDTYNMTFSLNKLPVANILVDVIQRPPNRILRIVFEKGLIEWNWISGLVRIYDSKTRTWKEFAHGEGYKGFNVEEMYQKELKEVIHSIKQGKNYVHTFEDELLAAKSVIIAEKSSQSKRTLKI